MSTFNRDAANLPLVELRFTLTSKYERRRRNDWIRCTTMSVPNPSPQLSVVLKWYDAVSTWNFEVFSSSLAEEYTQSTLPASAGQAPKDKAQGVAHARALAALVGNVPLAYEIKQCIEDPGRVWVHSRFYNQDSTFSSESIFIFSLSSGEDIKITAIQDFIDTKMAADLAAARASSVAQE